MARVPAKKAEMKPAMMIGRGVSRPVVMTSRKVTRPAPAIAGMARRKEKRAAAVLERPARRPPVMVMPERDVPGMRASICMQPMAIALVQVRVSMFSVVFLDEANLSAAQSAIPQTMRPVAMASGERMRSISNTDRATPRMPTGMVAMMILARREFSFLVLQVLMRSAMSVLRTQMMARRVATWTATSKSIPCSDQPRSLGMKMRWPEEEIGRNSVIPWTAPRMMGSRSCMRVFDVYSPVFLIGGRGEISPLGLDLAGAALLVSDLGRRSSSGFRRLRRRFLGCLPADSDEVCGDF